MSNYIPHNKWEHRDTNGGDKVDQYLLNLSKTVGRACDKWLASRGIVSRQFQGSSRYNETSREARSNQPDRAESHPAREIPLPPL